MLHLLIYFWFVLESQNLKENSKNNTELFQFQFQLNFCQRGTDIFF